jgi:hypothetical protein
LPREQRREKTIGVGERRGPLKKVIGFGGPVLLPQNIPTTIFCATRTPILFGRKPIVITEFFASLNIALSDNPDGAFGDQDFTVGVTGVVDIAGFVLQRFAIDIVAMIKFHNIWIVLRQAISGFFLGNSLPNVLDYPRTLFDILSSK